MLWQYWNKVVFTLNAQHAAAGKKGYAGQDIGLRYDPAKQLLEMQATSADPGLVITGIPFTRDKLYMAYVEIESERDTQLQLYYATVDPTVPVPDQSNVETHPIKTGSNTLYIPLFSGNLGSTLKLDPGTVPGKYRLHKFQIREVDPSSLQQTKE